MDSTMKKRFRAALLVILACLALTATTLGLILGTEKGREFLLDTIAQATAAPDFALRLEGLRLGETWRLSRVTVGDASGPWLRAENLSVRPALADLMRGRLTLLHAGVARLEITRLPESPETPEEAQPWQSPALPPLRIHAMDIDHLRLGPDVAGHEALLALHGSLVLDQNQPSATLRIARLDRTEDVLELDAGLNLSTNTLDLRLDLHEGPQGLLHDTLGVNGTQGIWLEAIGNGPLDAWDLTIQSSLSDVASLNGNATLALNENPSAKLRALITSGPAWGNFTGLPQTDIAIQTQGQWLESILRISHLDLRSQLGTLTGNATWDFESDILESEARAEDVELAWLMPENVKSGPLHASAILRREPRGLRSEVKVQLRDWLVSGHNVPEAAARMDLELPADTASWHLLAQIQAQTPDLADGLRSWSANATLGQDGQTFFADNLRLESQRLGIVANATLDSSMRLDARVNVRELTLGEGLQPLSAVVDTKLNADLFLAAASMNGTLETHAVHLEGLPPGLMDMLGQGGKMLARFSLNPQRLVLHKAELRARTTAEASAEFDLEQNTFAGRLEATLPQIQTEAFDVTQGASLQASASGTPESFLLDLSAAAEKLSWQDMSLDSLTATVEARGLPGRPAATVRAKAMAGQEPASLDLRVEPVQNRLRFAEALLQLPDTSLDFSGDLDLDSLLLVGDANVQSTDLGTIGRILDMELGGEFSLQARLDALQGQQRATLKGQGKSLLIENIGIGTATITGSLADPDLPGGTDVGIELRAVDLAGMLADEFTARLRGAEAGVGFTVGLAHSPSQTRLATSGTLSSDLTHLVIDDLGGTLLQQDVRLLSPLDVSMSAAGAAWRETGLSFGTATLRTRGNLSRESADISADLTGFDPVLLEALLPDLPSANMNASLNVQGTSSEPDAHLRVQAGSIRLDSSDFEQFPELDATADLRLRQGALEATAGLASASGIKLDAQLSSPMPLDLFAPQFVPGAPLSGQLAGHARLLLLPRLLRLDDQTLEGDCDLDLRIAGTWEKPEFTGAATVHDARYENFRSGTILEKVNMNAQADGSTLALTLNATDGGSGKAEAVGQVDLLTFRHILDVLFDKFQLLRQDLIQSTAKGGLRLQGNLEGSELRGNITLDPTTIRLPSKTPADLAHIEVKEINTGTTAQAPTRPAPNFLLGLDLKVAIPARMIIAGRGLDSEWAGNLHVGGNQREPVVSGEMNLLRGKFEFLDRTFDLTKGTVSLSGETPPNPFLEVLGETRILENLIQVRISGPTRDFRLSLTSVPALPQDELLSMILFGRSLRQISPLQAVRLAQAAAEMTGLGGASPDFLDSIKSSLGLQEVDVSRDDQDNTSVGIGGYIGGKYYIRTQSSVSGQDRTRIEIQITPKISVETEVGEDSRQGGGVMWKHDY
jgi:translocation and assembly module TamB